MKKTFLLSLALSTVALLASCAGNAKQVSKAEAKQVAQAILEKQNDKSFKIPTAFCADSIVEGYFTDKETNKKVKETTNVHIGFDVENPYACSFTKTNGTLETLAIGYVTEEAAYFGNLEGYTKLSMTGLSGLDTLITTIHDQLVQAVDSRSTLKDLISGSEEMVSIFSDDYEEQMISVNTDLINLEVKCYSSGAGSLKVESSFSFEDKTSFVSSFEWKDYLLTKVLVEAKDGETGLSELDSTVITYNKFKRYTVKDFNLKELLAF